MPVQKLVQMEITAVASWSELASFRNTLHSVHSKQLHVSLASLLPVFTDLMMGLERFHFDL